MGVEPTLSAWEAGVLPMNYIRKYQLLYYSTHCRKFQQELFNPLRQNNQPGGDILIPSGQMESHRGARRESTGCPDTPAQYPPA